MTHIKFDSFESYLCFKTKVGNYYLPLTTYHLLLTTYYLPLTTYY